MSARLAAVIMSARFAAGLAATAVIIIAAEKSSVTAAAEDKDNDNYNPYPLSAVIAAVVSSEKSHKKYLLMHFVMYTMP